VAVGRGVDDGVPPFRGDLAWDNHLVDEHVPPIASTTIVLLRDADTRLEVLLLGRHLDSDFAAGALVFPGGKVDDIDRGMAPRRIQGANPHRWRQLLGTRDDREALGLLVAGVRETFEEAGVLLAVREDGSRLTAADLARDSFQEARRRLAARGAPWDWRDWLDDEGLVLDLGALAMWSWWVTPKGRRKRFDTRFLVAHLPEGQDARHDDVETTSLRWIRPSEALAAHARGEVSMMFPTRCNLETLDTYPSAHAAVEAARCYRVDRRRIEPTLVDVGGRLVVQHPHRGPVDHL